MILIEEDCLHVGFKHLCILLPLRIVAQDIMPESLRLLNIEKLQSSCLLIGSSDTYGESHGGWYPFANCMVLSSSGRRCGNSPTDGMKRRGRPVPSSGPLWGEENSAADPFIKAPLAWFSGFGSRTITSLVLRRVAVPRSLG